MADQSSSEKEHPYAYLAPPHDISMGLYPPKASVPSGSSDDNVDSSSSMTLQSRLAYNQVTIADNGKVMSPLFKKLLRQRHGYCLDCQGPPVLLYEVVPVVADHSDSKKQKTKLGNAKSVPGECDGGICLKCRLNGINTQDEPENNINGNIASKEEEIADKYRIAKRPEDVAKNDLLSMPSDLDITPPSLVRQSQVNEKPNSIRSTPWDSISPPIPLVRQPEVNHKPKSKTSKPSDTFPPPEQCDLLKKKKPSSTFPKEGVRFSYILKEFCTHHSLEGLTTTQVCNTIIKPTTAKHQSSFCQLLQQTNPSAYGEKACLFVSHAHRYLFLDVISALRYHLRDEPDIIIWFDLFSINQHQPMDWTYEWLSTTFKTAIQDLGRTVMVMSPWNDPIPFTRAWCIFEAYATGVTKGKYEIALSKKDRKQFLEDIIREPQQSIDEMLSNIRAEKSTCTGEADKRQLFLVIHQSVGFSGISEMVFKQYRDWVVKVPLVEGLKQCQDEKDEMIMKRSLGILYMGQGKYRHAKAFLQDAYRKQSKNLGNNHPDTQKTALGLVELFIMLGKYVQSMELLKDVFEVSSISFDYGDVNCFAMELNALLRFHRGEYKLSYQLYTFCWDKRLECLGRHHPLTLQAMSSCGALSSLKAPDLLSGGLVDPYSGLGILSECFHRQKAVMGEKHPQTLATMYRLADAYVGIGNSAGPFYVEEARRLHELCLKRRTAILGAHHPKTLESMVRVARVDDLHSQHTEGLMEDFLRKQRETLGNWHPETQATCDCLANLYISKKKLGKAQSLYNVCADQVSPGMLTNAIESAEQLFLVKDQERYGDYLRRVGHCVMIKKILLGIQHWDTTRSMVDLGLLYKAAGRLHAALSLLKPALAIQKLTFGEDHEETMATTIHLTGLLKAQGDRKGAERILKTLLDKAKAKLGMDDPLVLQIMYELGGQSTRETSKELLIDCQARRKYLQNPDHADTPDTLEALDVLDALFHSGQLDNLFLLDQLYKLENLKERVMRDYEDTSYEDRIYMQTEIEDILQDPSVVPWHVWFGLQTYGWGYQETILYEPLY